MGHGRGAAVLEAMKLTMGTSGVMIIGFIEGTDNNRDGHGGITTPNGKVSTGKRRL